MMDIYKVRRMKLVELMEIHHRHGYGDYDESYEEFEEQWLSEEHTIIPRYASIAGDETYGMIHLFETAQEAVDDQAAIPSNGEYLNVPAGAIDLDTGREVMYELKAVLMEENV